MLKTHRGDRGHVSDLFFPALWLVDRPYLCTNTQPGVVAMVTSWGLVPGCVFYKQKCAWEIVSEKQDQNDSASGLHTFESQLPQDDLWLHGGLSAEHIDKVSECSLGMDG